MFIAQLTQWKKDKSKKTDESQEKFEHLADVISRKHQPLLHHFALSCLPQRGELHFKFYIIQQCKQCFAVFDDGRVKFLATQPYRCIVSSRCTNSDITLYGRPNALTKKRLPFLFLWLCNGTSLISLSLAKASFIDFSLIYGAHIWAMQNGIFFFHECWWKTRAKWKRNEGDYKQKMQSAIKAHEITSCMDPKCARNQKSSSEKKQTGFRAQPFWCIRVFQSSEELQTVSWVMCKM